MKFLNSPWFPGLLGLLLVLLIIANLCSDRSNPIPDTAAQEWEGPDTAAIPLIADGAQIAYGRQLIIHTAAYLGPHGSVAQISNGMNCQNCHAQAGEQLFGNSFAVAAVNYPQFSPRTGKIESLADRINSCMQRSMNGSVLDSTGKESKAMVAYIKWVGGDVTPASAPKDAGTEKLPYLTHAADPLKGAAIFNSKCAVCHGKNGQGALAADSGSYTYPPLWGPHSYNVSAGMYRITKLAAFIKNNMPYGTTYKNPQLSNTEAWDVAAYIEMQPRPHKFFPGDWPNIKKKPIDYPFGPYADKFSERQHQLGPFVDIATLVKK